MEEQKRLIDAYRKKLELLRKVCQIMEEKAAILMSHNLARLESSLEAEALLQHELTEQDQVVRLRERELARQCGLAEPVDWKTLSLRLKGEDGEEINQLRQALRAVVEEMRHLNMKNMALVENGQLFVESVLAAICPAPTYHPNLLHRHGPLPSRLSVEC
jgi:flagellar biosynthesis/type III secretory pathway chaperone